MAQSANAKEKTLTGAPGQDAYDVDDANEGLRDKRVRQDVEFDLIDTKTGEYAKPAPKAPSRKSPEA